MKKESFLFLFFCGIICFSCKKIDISEFYEQYKIDSSIIEIIQTIGDDKINRITKKTIPYSISESFDDILNYYSGENITYDSFIDLYYSEINKKNYWGNSRMFSSNNKMCVFTPCKYNQNKGKLNFIFCYKDMNEFNIYDIEYSVLTDKYFDELFNVLLKNSNF